MNLSKDHLILTEIRSGYYRVSYEPDDEVTPSFEGAIQVDFDIQTDGDNIDSPIMTESTLERIDFVKCQVWDSEGFQDITDTELGQMFLGMLEELIKDELQ